LTYRSNDVTILAILKNKPSYSPAPREPVGATSVPAPSSPRRAAATHGRPRLVTLRGRQRHTTYLILEGLNYLGRTGEQPVDIDLWEQEQPDRIWSSPRHALIRFEGGRLTLEDLHSSNGTYLNRARLTPGEPRPLRADDVIQIGAIQLRLEA
jgi:hypothetical protein